jgi:hypothetical protein
LLRKESAAGAMEFSTRQEAQKLEEIGYHGMELDVSS